MCRAAAVSQPHSAASPQGLSAGTPRAIQGSQVDEKAEVNSVLCGFVFQQGQESPTKPWCQCTRCRKITGKEENQSLALMKTALLGQSFYLLWGLLLRV